MIDIQIADIIEASGIDIVMSLPCNMLSEIISEISHRKLIHVPVCREEEGVGIAAGAALAGKKSLLLMQNSGLGNSINALLSLTRLYKLPLFIIMSHRGSKGEQISAQIPMGKAAPALLKTLNIDFIIIKSRIDLKKIKPFICQTYKKNIVRAAFLSRELWHEAE